MSTVDTKQSTLAWLERLVAFDTTSSKSNVELIDSIRAEADRLGILSQTTYDDSGQKANILLTLADRFGRTQGGVVLSGHTDVVPADGSQWATDPFVLTRRENKLHGRGTTDMKGFIAVALGALPDLISRPLDRPVQLALTYDEEVGCLGVSRLIEAAEDGGTKPSLCIVGEPSGMEMIAGHKSIGIVKVTFMGKSAHSSLTRDGVNAIEYAGRAIAAIREIADHYRTNGPFDHEYEVEHSTLSVNLAAGGSAANVVADRCEIVCEVRTVAGQSPLGVVEEIRSIVGELEQEMKQESAATSAEVELIAIVPGLDAARDGDAARFLAELGIVTSPTKVSYGTEAGIFELSDVSSVICGPGHMTQAHKPDEFIEVEQLIACEQFMSRLAETLHGEGSLIR